MNGIQNFNDLVEVYDSWFDEHLEIYQAEMETLATLVPGTGRGLEIGVGTGRFAEPFGIRTGIDPARKALIYALARDIHVCQAVGEHIPFESSQFDYALLNTIDPFVPDIKTILNETYRVLNIQGQIIIGMIDKDSHLGQIYDADKRNDPFFRSAHFHSADEMITYLRNADFTNIICRQTLMDHPNPVAHESEQNDETIKQSLPIKDGYGEGGFIALRAEKLTSNRNPKVSIDAKQFGSKR